MWKLLGAFFMFAEQHIKCFENLGFKYGMQKVQKTVN